MKKTTTKKAEPSDENAMYKIVLESATATRPERCLTFESMNQALDAVNAFGYELSEIYHRNLDGSWSQPPPDPDIHEVAITIKLKIRANSDLKAQEVALTMIDRVSYLILEHPAVEQLTVPLSPDNPRTIEPLKPPSLARKAAMKKASPNLLTTNEGDR